ncbi:MAG: biosynthetic-type acetolactate synthase large subunit [Clostridiaceae bacterium]|jgi:acetolactate synthase-1/2/3 large subunit|nr:biosynthetic-type acetolactate synthase large subunit [Clostridiaceae bacterium]
MNGAQSIIQFLKDKGVNPAFGYPGGSVIVLYDAIYQMNFPHILTRHEQGAVHAAEGYAKITGKPGVVFATSGPGATNLVTGIADAYLDSVPILAITGAVSRNAIGKDAFQEADITGITQPITKYNYLVMSPEDLIPTLEEAWNLTTEGRPGPVLVNIPKDLFLTEIPERNGKGEGVIIHRPPRKVAANRVPRVYEALRSASKPLLLVGGGVVLSEGGSEALREFAEITGIPVAGTMMAKGVIDERNPQYLGMVGMHGIPQANTAIGRCDLLLAVGCRFSDRIIGNPEKYTQGIKRTIIHVDIDPAEIGKNIRPDIEIEDDACNFFRCMIEQLPTDDFGALWADWKSELIQKAERYAKICKKLHDLDDRLLPEAVIHAVSEAYRGENPILVTDVGQQQIFAAQHFVVESNRSFLTSGGLGTMGTGLPYAIGAAIAAPDRPVVLFVGDGGLQMTIQELGPLKSLGLNVKVVICDNQQLGMVRQWQELFYGKRYSQTILDNNPNFIQIADAYGLKGGRATCAGELMAEIEKMRETKEPYVLHVMLDVKELVYPMIPAGKNPEDMMMPGM